MWEFALKFIKYQLKQVHITLSLPYKTSWTMANFLLSAVSGVWRVESDEQEKKFGNNYQLPNLLVLKWYSSANNSICCKVN